MHTHTNTNTTETEPAKKKVNKKVKEVAIGEIEQETPSFSHFC